LNARGSLSYPRIVFLSLPLLVAFPFAMSYLPTGSYMLHLTIMLFYYVIMASTYNLLFGYGGQLTFAHVALAGSSGYLSGLISLQLQVSPWLSMPIAALIIAAISYAMALVCLRMRGPYLALATLGFAESMRLIVAIEYKYTGGMMGLSVPYLLRTDSRIPYYFIALALVMLALYVVHKVVKSRLGLFIRAIREDEDVAPIIGIDNRSVKVKTFTISGFFAGLSGAFIGHYLHVLSPDNLQINLMVMVIAMVVVGGLGSFVGPILGAIVVYLSSEYLRATLGAYHFMIFGLVVIVLMRYARGGLVQLLGRFRVRISSALHERR